MGNIIAEEIDAQLQNKFKLFELDEGRKIVSISIEKLTAIINKSILKYIKKHGLKTFNEFLSIQDRMNRVEKGDLNSKK